MRFLRRVLGSHRASSAAPPLALYDSAAAPDSRRADTLLAALDIDAAINAHERWKARLMDYLEGRSQVGLDPEVIRRDNYSALGRWLHGVGREMLGHHPEYPMLLARHRYFHEQAAEIVELAQQGEWERVVAILNGGYRFASNQIVILLKSIRHSVSQESA